MEGRGQEERKEEGMEKRRKVILPSSFSSTGPRQKSLLETGEALLWGRANERIFDIGLKIQIVI